jgi:hypothetical protein
LLPLVQGSVIALLITIVNLRHFYDKNYLVIVIYSVLGAAVLGALVFYVTFAVTEIAVRRDARYTFAEIVPKALIYSRYAGDYFTGNYLSGNKLETARKLYIIPLKTLKSVGLCEKSGAIYLESEITDGNGSIRAYNDRSERLNYKLLDGFPDFDSWWYNENGFTILNELKIPPLFGNPEESRKLCEKIGEAKRNFDNAPQPRPYIHQELDFVKRKKALNKLKKHAGA